MKCIRMASIDSGWSWVVSAACFFNMFSVAGLFRSSGVLFTSIINVYGTTREEASWPFSLAATVGLLVAVINGILCQLLTIRTITFSATLLCSVGIALCFTAKSVATITIFYGVIYGSGIGIASLCNLVIICQYFDRYKTIATGIAYAGSSVGAFVLPPLLEYLLEIYGLRGTFLIASAIILQGLVAAALFRPQQLQLHSSKDDTKIADSQFSSVKILRSFIKIFQYRVFYLIWISYLTFHFTYFIFPTVILDYASDMKIDKSISVYMLSAYSIADLCARLSCGWITDVGLVKRKHVVATVFILQSLLLMMAPFSTTYVLLIVLSVGIGFFTGCLMVNWSVLFAEYLGLIHLPTALGTIFTMSGILPFFYPSIIGYYRDVRGNYSLLFYTCAASQLLTGLLWCFESCIVKTKTPKQEDNITPL